MRVALVGPAHPVKGGIAAHTTELAWRLEAAGHEVRIVSWARIYPPILYPGNQFVPEGKPDLTPFPHTYPWLRWNDPVSWLRAGRRMRGADLVVLVSFLSVQVPALLAVRRSVPRPRPRVVVLAHNVLPHEGHPGAERLIGALLRSGDGVLTHSDAMAAEAWELGARSVRMASLPPHLPGGSPTVGQEHEFRRAVAGRHRERVRVLGLGMIRAYKGFDLLLEAAREVDGVEVTVAGAAFRGAGERLRALAADPALAGRVTLLDGYVPGAEVPRLLRDHDVLALPYRRATASQNVVLAHAYGVPVVVSDTGTLAHQVRDGIDGLVVPPGDLPALAAALHHLTEPGVLDKLRAEVPTVDLDRPWNAYLDALLQVGAA